MRVLGSALLAVTLVGCSCHGADVADARVGRHDGGPPGDVVYPPGVGEVCGNGSDDDGDGLVDCADHECQAPDVDPGTVDFEAAYGFLYRGSTGACAGAAMQPGYVDGTIDDALFAVVRGRVIDSGTSAPLGGARVFVQGEPGLGEVRSQADGIFELAVNAGTSVLVSVTLDGHVAVQRAIPVRPHDFAWAGDIAMTPIDPASAVISMGSTGAQVLRASVVEDQDGARRATVVFPSRLSATVHAADGTMRSPSQLTFHATEVTVGPNGPDAMPGLLPSTTSYTYAIEVSADEVDMQSESIELSSPVSLFVDNFLSFPVGTIAPLGTYDRRNGTWTAEQNGRVVRVVGVSGGLADVDSDGDRRGDDTVPREARSALASLHGVGDELMWVRVPHFTLIDINWGHATPPNGARAPGSGGSGGGVHGACTRAGSIIECENQILGEVIPLVGGGTLAYRSGRVPGYSPAYEIEFSTEPEGPAGALVRQILIEWSVAGHHFGPYSYPPNAGGRARLTAWDGTDIHGRAVSGTAMASVQIAYQYDAEYRDPSEVDASAFDDPGTTVSTPLVEARAPITLTRRFERRLGVIDPRRAGLGGWTLTAHHYYDRSGRALWMGDGTLVDLRTLGTQVQWSSAPTGGWLVAEPGGTYLNAYGAQLFRRSGARPVDTVIAFTGDRSASTGDEGPATAATVGYGIGQVAEAPDGNIYVVDLGNPFAGGACVRRIDTSGIIHRFAGMCGDFAPEDGDGGPALSARLGTVTALAAGRDGSVYVASLFGNVVRRIRPDGVIERYAGGGAGYADGASATGIALSSPSALAVDEDDRLLIGDVGRIVRIVPGPSGNVVRGVAGNGTPGVDGDGGAAVAAQVGNIGGIITMPGGGICFTQSVQGVVRCISGGAATIETVAGGGETPIHDTGFLLGQPATGGNFMGVGSLARTPNGGLLFSVDPLLFETTALFSFRSDGLTQWPSADGAALYLFDGSGRHVRTVDATLGLPLLEFSYDPMGRLETVTDDVGHTMTMDRTGTSAVTITGFFGHVHTLALDANEWLSSVTDPIGGVWATPTQASGLLQSFTMPDDATSTFRYEDGRLSDDIRADGHSVHLDYALGPLGEQITVTGPRPGQREVYGIEPSPSTLFHSRQQQQEGAGSALVSVTPYGDRRIELATGTIIHEGLAADPRLGAAGAYLTSRLVVFPSGRTWQTIERRTVDPVGADTAVLPHAVTEVVVGGRTMSSSWDPATRTATTTMPSGRQSTTTLDATGRVVSEQAPGLDPVSYTYDADGLLASVTAGTGVAARTYRYTYERGALRTVTDPLMRTTTVMRDDAGRAMSVTTADGRVLALGYDALDRPTSITPPSRGAWSFEYGPVGALQHVMPPAGSDPGSAVDITADEDGQPLTRTQGTGVTIGYTRGATGGRMEQVRLRRGVFRSEHDGHGLLSALVAPDGQRIGFDYDGEALVAVHASGGPASGDVILEWADETNDLAAWSVAGARVDVTRDADGAPSALGDLVITRDPPTGLVSDTAAAGVTAHFSHNSLGEETLRTFTGPAGLLYEHQVLARDGLGRITQARENVRGTSHTYTYHYDATDRLDEVRRDGTVIETYGYHPNGSRTSYARGGASGTDVADVQERVTSHGAETIRYRSDGATETRTSASGTTTYDFDEVGTLLGAMLPDGRHVTYDLDPRGRRVGRRVDGTLERAWLYGLGQQPIAEADGSGAVTRVFVYGPVNALAPDYVIEGAERYRLVTDVRGSVRLVVRGSDGAVMQQLDYDAYGRVTNDTAPGFQPFGFAGGLYDPSTHLVRFGAREYDAELGRWLTADPAGFGGGLNAYEYGGGDPINHIDPNGEFFVAIIVPIILLQAAFSTVGRAVQDECITATQMVAQFVVQAAVDIVIAGAMEMASGWAMGRFEAYLAGGRGAAADAIAEEMAGACRGGFCDPGCSFDGETPVETEEGLHPISSIRAGQRVWALDESTGQWGYHEVTAMSAHPGRALSLELVDDEAGVTDAIVVSTNHPLFTRRGWIEVGDLLPGDEIYTSRGGWLRVGNTAWAEGERELYDLTVEDAQTYFVGDVGAWAHNCPDWPRHHIFPQQYRSWFASRGFGAIDDFTVEVPRGFHQTLHGAGGAPSWNSEWENFITSNPAATVDQIAEQGARMFYNRGVAGAGRWIGRYRAPR